mgnify:CR=1 FL=1
MIDSLPFLLAIFAVALLYASVGHGGASGYLAVMALFSVTPEWLRPSALTLNLLVSAIGTVAFYRAGHFRSRLFWPLGLSAVPFAFIGGSVSIPDAAFRWLLALALRPAVDDLHPLLPWMALAVLTAGFLGASWGSRIASSRQVRYALAGVLALAIGKLAFA